MHWKENRQITHLKVLMILTYGRLVIMGNKKLKFSGILKLIQESDDYIIDDLLDEIDWTIENTKKRFL